MAKFSLYKYVKSKGSWRYRRAAFHTTNKKIKPDIVIVNGGTPSRGALLLEPSRRLIDVGLDALDAQRRRALRIAQLECERLGGAPVAIDERLKSETLATASAAYLENLALEVASGNKSRGTYDLFRVTLEKFSANCKLTEMQQITARHLDQYAAHILKTSRTHSRRSAKNEYLRVLQFVEARGLKLTKNGERIGLKHAHGLFCGAVKQTPCMLAHGQARTSALPCALRRPPRRPESRRYRASRKSASTRCG
jgi:hypothetical protein